MNVFEGIVLGILQGITEWLPISSSGQSMLLLINLLNVPPKEAFSTSVLLHIGSLFAVLYYFRDRLMGILADKSLLNFLVFASISSAIIGLPLYFGAINLFTAVSGEAATMFIGVMLIATGMILKNTKATTRTDFNNKDAILTGGAQGIAVLPGVSRSGTTIAALLLRGVEQETALTLSFLLALPAIFGLVILEAKDGIALLNPPLLAGILTSFIVSLATMHYFIALSKKVDFSNFVILIGSLAFFIPLFIMGLEGLIGH